MTGTCLRLSATDVLSALMAIDAITPCARNLVGRTNPSAPAAAGADVTARLDRGPAELVELVMVDRGTPTRCLLPASGLLASRAAVLTVVAARTLMAPGVVTAAVLGSGHAAQPQLMMIAHFVPEVSHIAVCLAGPDRGLDPRVLDLVAREGIELTLTTDVRQAVFGANLVVATSADLGRARYPQLAGGALLVNASGVDLADDVVDRIDKVYTDAPDLLAGHRDRHFVRRHFAVGATGEARRVPSSGHPPGFALGIGDVLGGSHRCRVGAEEIRLVELLSADESDVGLAVDLYRAACLLGLGSPVGQDLS